MTIHFARFGRHLSAGACLILLGACSAESVSTAPDAQLNKFNGKNGFSPFSLEYMDDLLCSAHGGFSVWTVLTANVKIASEQTKADGSVRVVEILSNGRINLSANGRTLSSALAGTAFYDFDAGGNLIKTTFVGSNGVFTVPGVGRVGAETGKLVIDANGNVLRETGHHDVFGSNPDTAKLCQYLS